MKKKVYTIFHYCSGFGPEINRAIMDLLSVELYEDDDIDVFISHLEIGRDTPETEAMRTCFKRILHSDEVWKYTVKAQVIRASTGETMTRFPFLASARMEFERDVARECGIPVIEKEFPKDVQDYVEAVYAQWLTKKEEPKPELAFTFDEGGS